LETFIVSNGSPKFLISTDVPVVGGIPRWTTEPAFLSAEQWHDHYGPATWTRFAAAKRRFDPNNVLNPSVGIF
jgi:hypothetical protein